MTALEQLLQSIPDVKVIADAVSLNQYTPLDLSVSNAKLLEESLGTSTEFETYIERYLAQNNAKVAFGGYNEERNLYKRSTIFKDDAIDERNMHIGLDLWIKAGTPILAALDGNVHSFNYNSGFGDYGPTIILEHKVENQVFYTLYGHLSLESIENLEIGAFFKKGETIATLGAAAVNGDYSPHLHFQIIDDIQGKLGDYPGVCSKNDLAFYLENCPDPNLLLKLNTPK
ncbi:peptidoglycan DD-metalloendopeptidase family protein [Flavobacterium muglaense]|uniref:Peptidoglycan DD-metalloendopeptidase family protein n=1 Tax=Flavobacterium muglaense TaxID=2764716 RepID=A0A923N0W8_9FLAO|nr:peptidoglycan DD-metalloendopeptidase family protein [Flavobacterium muglaense]MBC5838889.1 peptidoglycan DD-metalloendopeptidase family protein [Flavobacterium muglaense]MBC5845371.1 peptidoglycan DD-metalloendopeptidase family protein [Flavobacterium muglaense]